MKLFKNLFFFFASFICFTASALDLDKINPTDFIGGTPYKSSTNTQSVSNSQRAVDSNSRSTRGLYKNSHHARNLDAQIKNYQASRKNNSLIKNYRGSHHERALDAQIRAYRPSARENERVFGSPFRKTQSEKSSSSKKSKLEKLIDQGVLSIIIGKDGKSRLVENRR